MNAPRETQAADLFDSETASALSWLAPDGPAMARVQRSACGRYWVSEVTDSARGLQWREAWTAAGKFLGEFGCARDAREACEQHYREGK